MKAILEFSLPEDEIEFNRVNKSVNMACALFDILQLRKTCSNQFDCDEGDAIDGINVMANAIEKILEKYAVNIDKLIE